MQASLDIEIKARADAVRAKKKFESQLNDVELQLDHSNKQIVEQTKVIKKLQGNLKVISNQTKVEEKELKLLSFNLTVNVDICIS